jgi:hypothetical protein
MHHIETTDTRSETFTMTGRLRWSNAIGLLIVTPLWSIGNTAYAAFHVWDIVEVYSDSAGTVQFIELFTASSGQQVAAGTNGGIESNSNSFAFPTDLPSSSTAGKTFLVGTSSYNDLAANDENVPVPDYVVVDNFFSTLGDSLRATWQNGSTFDTLTFVADDLPLDGINSLNNPNNNASTYTSEINSPQNFAGETGSIVLADDGLAGDYNDDGTVNAADYVAWRNAVDSGGSLVNESDNPGTVDDGDYTYWAAHYGETSDDGSGASTLAIPEPATTWLAIATCFAVVLKRRRRR